MKPLVVSCAVLGTSFILVAGTTAPSRRVTAVIAVLLVTVLGGCRVGTDLPEPEVATLEADEATELVTRLLGETLTNSVYSENHVAFAHSHGAAAVHAHPVSGPYLHDGQALDGPDLSHHNLFNFDLAAETPCADGGAVLMESVVTGEGNPALRQGKVHYVMIQTHRGCTLRLSAAGGGEFVLDAAPYLTVEAHAVNDGTTTEVYGYAEGGLGWQAEAKGGTCSVELVYGASAATMAEIAEVTVTGSFCGIQLEESIPIGTLLP